MPVSMLFLTAYRVAQCATADDRSVKFILQVQTVETVERFSRLQDVLHKENERSLFII